MRSVHRDHHALLRAAASSGPLGYVPKAMADLPSESLRLKELVARIFDQSWGSSCVGQMIAKAIGIRLAAEGLIVPEFSALGAYGLGRAGMRIPGQRPVEPLRDTGCYPTVAAAMCGAWGLPFERVWPYDIDARPELINQDLPVDVLEDSVTHALVETARVNDADEGRLLATRALLAQDFPVGLGTYVGGDFQRYVGGVLKPETRSDGGGHALLLIGYKNELFLGVNSWGDQWGEAGFFWASEDFVLDPRADDFLVFRGGPKMPRSIPRSWLEAA